MDRAKRKHQDVLVCFPSYAFSAYGADGDPIAEIKSWFLERCGKISNTRSKALDL
jgi:hypothetical protein